MTTVPELLVRGLGVPPVETVEAVDVPAVVAPYWEATCVGNAREIARLLEQIRYAGKRRSVGLGAVHHWEIAAASEGFALVRDGRLTRPLPALAVGSWTAPCPSARRRRWLDAAPVAVGAVGARLVGGYGGHA